LSNFKLINSDLFQAVSKQALQSHRKRANYNFHELSEVYQRFLNVLTIGTYVQPHRHLSPAKPETFIALQGDLGFLLFDDQGKIIDSFLLSSKGPNFGIDIQPGVWHSIVCLTDTCICFEGKSGPYNPDTDKEFANFSYPEGSEDSILELKKWESIFKQKSKY
jgi:cupin fold WbuC family metalloprotein